MTLSHFIEICRVLQDELPSREEYVEAHWRDFQPLSEGLARSVAAQQWDTLVHEI